MSDRVIITGASGFVGGSLARRFVARGLSVVGLARRDLSGQPFPTRRIEFREEEIAALVGELQPSIIIHAAGSASVAASIADPARDLDAQVGLFRRVLDGVCRSAERPRVIFVSSAAVYGNPERLPIAEDARLQPISPYGDHKLAAERLAREYAESLGVPTLIVRLFSLFGPSQRRLLLWELFEQFRDRPEVVVAGTGDEARDYLHVDDLADLLLRLLPRVERPTLTVNLASGASITVRELVSRMGRILKSDKPVVFRGKALPGNPTRWQADVSRLESLVGPAALGGFDERLASTLDQWRA